MATTEVENVDKAVAAMVDRLKNSGSEGVPFTELTAIADSVGGDVGPPFHDISYPGHPNVILSWDVSGFGVRAYQEFHRRYSHCVDPRPVSAFIWLMDARDIPALPVADNESLDYSTPHWLPLMLFWDHSAA
jgi:hypothetical protein